MDELWERAVKTAIDGRADTSPVRTLTLDGAVKCYNGRLPSQTLLEKFQDLEHLSIANVGISSLQKFPRLRNLTRLILSDNRISGGLEFLVEANLRSLRDLDLSNNRIQCFEDLAPLARLDLVSLDLYECPVTRIENYRGRVFGLIEGLKYLDKLDVDENDEDDDDEYDDDEDEDQGSGEIVGENGSGRGSNGGDGVVDDDEDEDEREGFRNGDVVDDVEDEAESDDDEDDDDVAEAHEIVDSDEDEEGVEEEEGEGVGVGSMPRMIGNGVEIDGHEQGEEDSDDAGEYEEEEDNNEEEEEDFRVRPVRQVADVEGSDLDPENEVDDDAEVEEEVDDEEHPHREAHVQSLPSSRSDLKRKREDRNKDDSNDDDSDDDDDVNDDVVQDVSLKPH